MNSLFAIHPFFHCLSFSNDFCEGRQAINYILMSRTSNLGDPQKFQLASIVTKNSRTGITSNRRLLVVKAGHLYYYSNIPKSFTGDNIKILQQFHQLPKCSIDLLHISRVNGFQPTSSYFSIEFQAKHMLQRQDIRRTLVNQDFNFTPRNTQELVTWQFTCDNQFIKQRWVSALLHLRDYYRTEQQNIQKYFEGVHEEPKSSNGSISSRSSLKVSPWRESVASRKSYTLDNSKYGLELRPEGSPREASNKIEQPFLKKGKSEDVKNFQYPEFEMIIKEEEPKQSKAEPKQVKIEEAFKVHQVKKEEPPKQTMQKPPVITTQPVIEEVQEEPSIEQTPIKDNSFSDEEDKVQRRASMQKTLNDLKLFSETHRPNFASPPANPPNPSLPPTSITPILPELQLVQEKVSAKMGKFSNNHSHTARSNISDGRAEEDWNREGKERGWEWLIGESCRNTAKFDYRVDRQKELIGLCESFKQRAINGLSQWLQTKVQGEGGGGEQQSGRCKLLQIGGVQLKVALLTTQNILINGKPRIFFNQDSIKNLKREFKVYQNLSKMIMRRLRREPTLALRVPLAFYIEYKGVSCIATELGEAPEAADLEEERWATERSVMQEQGYRAEWFNFTISAGGYLIARLRIRGKSLEKDEQGLKEHLKRILKVGSGDKNHNIVFDSPIDRAFLEVARKEQASTSAESMERYVKGLRGAKRLEGTCPKEEIIAALTNCLFCKQLRKVYRSAQGEIDQTHFFNLVFKGDPAITPLLEQACCPPLVPSGQLFSFIQHYFGVVLEADEKVFREYYLSPCSADRRRKKDLFFSATVSPLVREYPLQQLEVIQCFNKLPIYLQTRHPLTEAALSRKKQVFHLRSEGLTLGSRLQLLYDEACFFYFEADFIGCIRKCKEYQQQCPRQYTKLFAVYLLMMKAYSEFSETDFSFTLKKATELVEFNYGENHSSLVSLYSLAAFYYNKLAGKPNGRQELIVVAGKLLGKAEELCLKHFGRATKQYLDLQLDLARLHRRNDPTVARFYLSQARQICQQNASLSNADTLITLNCDEVELNLQSGQLPQAESALLNALGLFDAKVPPRTRKHLLKLQYELGFYLQKYQYCEQAIERLWQMDSPQKYQAVELAYRAAVRQGGVQGQSLIDQNDSVRFQAREKSLLQLQREKMEHRSLLEMVTAAIEAKNTRLLTMIFFLSRV